jgi:hypothetical protein
MKIFIGPDVHKKARSRQTRRLLIVPFKKNYASNE